MADPPRPKIVRPNTKKEEEKKRAAEERARRQLREAKGTAANLLSTSDSFGSANASATKLSGASILG